MPQWASVKLNGQPLRGEVKPSTYTAIRRRWSHGDRIELDLPMEVALLQAHALVEETRNHAAVKRGPIVYCLESVDLPKEVAFDEVHLPRSPQWTVRHDPQLLGGVTVLETELVVWPGTGRPPGLYSKIRSQAGGQAAAASRIRARLVPYYAWCNRGRGQMTVWLPLD